MWIVWILRGFFVFWPLLALGVFRACRRLPKLQTSSLQEFPALTVLVPAANEQEAIGTTIRRLVAADYPDLHIVAINDRSQDATGSILEQLAEQEKRLEIVQIRELPNDWIGKVHALHCGWQRVKTPWFVVCDADVSFEADGLKKAVQHTLQNGFDHLSLVPQLGAQTQPAQWVLDLFTLMGIAGIPFDKKGQVGGSGFGIGAFQLINTDFFKRTPGFEGLRREVIDDIALGQMIKRNGGTSGIANGTEVLSLTWYANWMAIIKGLEKNLFAAATGYRRWPILPIVLLASLFLSSPLTLAWFGTHWDHLWVVSGLTLHFVLLAYAARELRIPGRRAFASPFALLTFLVAFCHSSWTVLRRGGVTWRGTFYPLALLRKSRKGAQKRQGH